MLIENRRKRCAGVFVAALVCFAGAASAQTAFRSVFVGNNGNLEGSVSSFRVNADNTVTFVSKYVTGSRPNTSVFDAGTNVQAIALRPDGKFIACFHGTSNSVSERITMLRVNADGTFSPPAGPGSGLYLTPDSPLDAEWVNDEFLAVLQTGAGNMFIYRFDEDALTLTQTSVVPTGGFTASLAVHPSRNFVVTQESTARSVRVFAISGGGVATQVGVATAGNYSLGVGVSPDGTKAFGGGGISGSGEDVTSFSINPSTGAISLVAGSPYTSPGSSPKQVAVTSDNLFALVAHGSDATVRVLAIDQSTGALTDTGFNFDVGFQGSLGEVAVSGAQMFVSDRDTISDGVMGLRSFTVGANGSLTQNGAMQSTAGSGPSSIQTFVPPPACAGDINGDGVTNTLDLTILLGAFGTSVPPGTSGDFDSSGFVNTADLTVLLGDFGCSG